MGISISWDSSNSEEEKKKIELPEWAIVELEHHIEQEIEYLGKRELSELGTVEDLDFIQYKIKKLEDDLKIIRDYMFENYSCPWAADRYSKFESKFTYLKGDKEK